MNKFIAEKNHSQQQRKIRYLLYLANYTNSRVIMSIVIMFIITIILTNSLFRVLFIPPLLDEHFLLPYYETISICAIRFCIIIILLQLGLIISWYILNQRMRTYNVALYLISIFLSSLLSASLLIFFSAVTGSNLIDLWILLLILFFAILGGWLCSYYMSDFISYVSNKSFYWQIVIIYFGYILLHKILGCYFPSMAYGKSTSMIEFWFTAPIFVLWNIANSAKIFEDIQDIIVIQAYATYRKQIIYCSCAVFCFSFTLFIPIWLFQYFAVIFFDTRYWFKLIVIVTIFIVLTYIKALRRFSK